MKEKRFLTNHELDIIRSEQDLLKGNINRMCTSDDIIELLKMFNFAILRINTIYNVCLKKFLNDNESEDF